MRFFNIFMTLLALLITVAPVSAEQIRIKFSHVVHRETPKGKASEYFKRLVEQRSGGRIRVELFPNSELGDEQQTLRALRENIVQMAAPSLSKLAGLNKQLQLFDLPFLFHDAAHLRRVIDGVVGQKLLAGASRDGLVALSFWDNGFKQLTANRPLVKPADLAGLKMRIEGSNVQKTQFEELGATTRTIPFPRLYEALENGDVDGQENSLSNIYSQQLFKVQSDLTISNHAYLEYLILTNREFWQQVPADLQVIIRGAIEDAAAYNREMAVQLNNSALEEIRRTKAMNIHVLSQAERDLWREKLKGIYPHLYDEIDANLVRQAQAERIR